MRQDDDDVEYIMGKKLDGREVLLRTLWVWLHGLLSWLPSGWANLIWVLLDVLESLEHTEGLIDISSECQVVDGGVLDDSFLVNDEESTKGNSILRQDSIGFRDFSLEIRDQWIGKVSESSLVTWSLHPGKMRELRVDGDSENLGVEVLELFISVREGCNLSWAHKSKVQWVEEEDDVLSLVLVEGNIDELLVIHSSGAEIWSGISHKRSLHVELSHRVRTQTSDLSHTMTVFLRDAS